MGPDLPTGSLSCFQPGLLSPEKCESEKVPWREKSVSLAITSSDMWVTGDTRTGAYRYH